ncbi:MAG: galactosyldiacylglycerol synthase [Candidatus Dormibacteraeota bacterium]|nr:galactosyldiacylglycerol synthase [Candidatus Dormibacteraeota bacterium]
MPLPLLFLIADTGGGHRAAATAVARRLATDYPGRFEVSIVDPAGTVSPGVLGRTAGLYGPLIQHGRWVWGALYHSTNSRAAIAALRHTALRPLRPVLEALVDRLQPVAVVSFHPLLNHVAATVVAARAPGVPVITVITDLVDIHAGWACRDVDAVVIPSPGGLDRCRRAGIPASHCHMLGLPVDSAFSRPPLRAAERRELQRSLGLDGRRFTVLVCSGADGSGSIARRARALAAADLDIDLAVICGRNQQAVADLRGLRDRHGRPVLVHGFVDNMAAWMRAADVAVTKAGPGSISEALCSGLPLLLTWYLPGQERGNVEWVVDIGAGRYVPGNAELVDAVAELSSPRSPALAEMRAAVRKAARPDATARIAALINAMATPAAP